MVPNAESTERLIFTFDVRELAGEVTFLDDGNIILHKDAQGSIAATRNRCRHRNGRFPILNECVLTCPNHRWQLDVSTMQYVNPSGISQQQLLVEVEAVVHVPGGG